MQLQIINVCSVRVGALYLIFENITVQKKK